MSFFEDASLVLIPSGYKASKVYSVKPTDGTGDLTFTRSLATATRVGPDGLIEKVRTNLILQSQGFNTASWSATFNGTGVAPVITANNAVAPDGTMTADTIVFNAGAGTTASDSSGIFQVITANGLFNGSFFARVASGTGQLMFRHVGGSSYTTINLTTTYQRFSVAETGATGFFEITIRRGLNEPINASVTAQLWGAQLESGDIATPYIPTTTAAVSVGMLANVPRLDYLGGGCPKLLLEPQRTNLGLYSEQFNNAGWTNAATTITANYGVSPDGFQNADRFQQVSVGALQQTIAVSASTAYTVSFYCKLLSGTNASLGVYNFNSNSFIFQDNLFSSLVVNQFVRVTRTFTTPVGCTSITGELWRDSTIDCVVYGFQLEQGSYATSYIPTLAAAVTRSADAASKTGISALIGGTSGTIFFEIKTNKTLTATDYKQFFYYTDAASTQAYMYINSSNQVQTSPSLANLVGSLVLVADTTYKVALAYALNDFKLFIDGVDRGGSVSGATFNAVNLASLGSFNGASEFNEFTFKQYLHFKTRLTNAQLAELTA